MRRLIVIFILMFSFGIFTLNSQSLNLKVGAFYPSADSELWETNFENLALNKQDMMDVYYGMEFEFFINRYSSFALEIGHYRQDIYTLYKDYEYEDGTPIYQDVSLSITSFELGFKLYPMGHRKVFLPYLGGGFGLYAWRYIQGGDFINFEDDTVFSGEARTNTLTPGFNVKLGFIYRLQHTLGFSFETRYHYLKGELSSFFEGFDKLDLSGFTFNVGVHFFLR